MVLADQALAIAGGVGQQLFPIGRAVKLVKCGSKVVNSTNPLAIAVNITLTVVECCAPPPLRLAATCAAFAASAASSAVAPNPISVGATLHFANQIYETC